MFFGVPAPEKPKGMFSGEKRGHGTTATICHLPQRAGGDRLKKSAKVRQVDYNWYTIVKWPVYIFAFGEYNLKQVNVSGIQIFRAQLLALNLRKVMLNAANIYLFWFILTKCKYIYRSLVPKSIGQGISTLSKINTNIDQ